MVAILRTNSKNKDFQFLNDQLNAELAIVDGDDHAFYSQYSSTDQINHIVLLYEDEKLAGCGGLREYSEGIMEIKRMYTLPDSRGRGIASKILAELEHWALQDNCSALILETGLRQEAAVALYLKNGYTQIPNFGPYHGVTNSVCFKKELNAPS